MTGILCQALACFSTQKKVPAFKFKQNGGRSELIRDCGGGVKIKNFYTGVAQYVKHAKTFQGTVLFDIHIYIITPPLIVSLVYGNTAVCEMIIVLLVLQIQLGAGNWPNPTMVFFIVLEYRISILSMKIKSSHYA